MTEDEMSAVEDEWSGTEDETSPTENDSSAPAEETSETPREPSSPDVYAFLQVNGSPSKSPKPWDHLPKDKSLFDLRLSQGELRERLRTTFADKLLEQAGVITLNSNGDAVLNPKLARNRTNILAVKFPRSEKIGELILGTGETLSGTSCFGASLMEIQTRRRILTQGGFLFVAATAEDRVVLRSLEVPVVPLRAFDGLYGDEISQLERLLSEPDAVLGRRRRKDAVEPRKFIEPVRLVFVNCSLARLDTSDVPAALETVARLRRLDAELGLRLPWYNILLWKPSPKCVAEIRSALAHGLVPSLVDIEADCKWLRPGSSLSRTGETSAPLRGPRAAAAAEWLK
jgi:hypothetical protein